ncbi:hypothetical protein POV27_12085 [Aureisphaera galaxeae]|uniref:hypothetical protein n=1 Tax=Aureisphaera galaxeae TaxID=1538023 RepID=UPI0023506C59|nr:hypothetical protein [Aureisphaera galaxeae]MDC8004794.1 hypothetical protein [Aureisphaera galaxeae]
MIFIKNKTHYDFIKIENLVDILVEHDKILMDLEDIEPWFRKNLPRIIPDESVVRISQRSYDSILDNLSNTITIFKDCSPHGAGDHSKFTFSTAAFQKTYEFKCIVTWDVDWATFKGN